MKLALITDPKGFNVLNMLTFSYHLVLAQHVRSDVKYQEFYEERRERGDFIMLDNGAAENVSLQLHELMSAAALVKPDEIVLPDVLGDMKATLEMSLDEMVLRVIPESKRAVCPQGNSLEEWWECFRKFTDFGNFRTVCVPKHLERFPGGRASIVERLIQGYWHERYTIHLLGIWDNPFPELMRLKPYVSIVRGIDTALPFALAQNGIELSREDIGHIPHKWGGKFSRVLALQNANTLWEWVWSYE